MTFTINSSSQAMHEASAVTPLMTKLWLTYRQRSDSINKSIWTQVVKTACNVSISLKRRKLPLNQYLIIVTLHCSLRKTNIALKQCNLSLWRYIVVLEKVTLPLNQSFTVVTQNCIKLRVVCISLLTCFKVSFILEVRSMRVVANSP